MADEYRIISNPSNEPSNNGSADMSALTQQLKDLNATNGKMLEVLSKMSQTNVRGNTPFNDKYRSARSGGSWGRNNSNFNIDLRNIQAQSKHAMERIMGDFFDGLENQVVNTITSSVRSRGKQVANDFAKELGIEINQIPKFLGQSLADKYLWNGAGNKIRETLTSKLDKGFGSLVDTFLDAIKGEDPDTQDFFKKIFGKGANSGAAQSAASVASGQSSAAASQVLSTASSNAGKFSGILDKAGGTVSKFANSSQLGQVAMKGLSKVATKLAASAGPYAALVIAAIVAIKKFNKEIIEPANDIIDAVKGMASVTNRYMDSRKKNLELAQKRIIADIDTVVLEPFNILQQAANNVYDAWDANVRLITATQGYNKADVQDLLASFSERLRQEGLSSVISSATLLENLSKVLESGLSGRVAEEFAYQATMLGAAIPTQDFFSYASTYSSVAANAVKEGRSVAEALDIANESIQSFASNLLYASRELSDGFTTGLQSAESLYAQSVKITQAAKSGNIGEISGVMTAVASIIGATAPDLASALTDAVYSAATGGNDSSIVALRSLAGVNASNTEFLKALAQNPKQVFTTIFHNLATMFGATPGAYMEAAEGYAELFGLSAEAFQRVDFEYLAQSIDQMNVTNGALAQNMNLLASGQTTLTKEQMVNRQVNEYLIEEGLAYVLDNEAGRAIQQHMWEEQIAREQMEATYGVEMVGNTLKLFERMATAINNILMFLNPLKAIQDTYNLVATLVEGVALTEDVKRSLIAGRVGQGNQRDYTNLITQNKDLQLVAKLPELLGSSSAYGAVQRWTKTVNAASNPYLMGYDALGNPLQQASRFDTRGAGTGWGGRRPSSRYNWGVVSKSTATAVFNALANSPTYTSAAATTPSGKSISSRQKQNMDAFLASATEFMGEGQTYEDWIASAKKKGISGLSSALEDYGMTEEDLKNFYTQKAGMAEQQAIRDREKQFQESGISFWTVEFIKFRDELYRRNDQDMSKITQFHKDCLAKQDQTNLLLGEVNILGELRKQTTFLDGIAKISNEFGKYYLNMSLVNGDFIKLTNANWNYIKEEAKSNKQVDLVNLLAQELTKNTADITTPAAQTNTLLAAILQVLQAILTQSANSAGTLSLPDTLTALSMGVTQKM